MKNAIRLSLAVLLAAGAPALAAAPSLTPIGAAAAVRGAVKAVAPGQAVGRIVGSGKPLFLNDHVTTDAQGRLQILLLDQTVFTLGPDADMVLDAFVYDPTTDAGKVSAQIAKGAFRFVTGKVARAHPEDMKVKLNVGVIGIRGTVVVGETGPDGSTVINAGAGPGNNADEPPSAISVTNGGKTVFIGRTGEGVRVPPGGAPSSPADLTKELDRLSAILQTRPGDQGARGPLDAPATSRSGQGAARGRELALAELSDLGLASGANALQTNANQQGFGIPNGNSDWSQIAQLSGTGVYSGAGTWTCSGSFCGTGTAAMSFTLNANFDAKTVTGGGITLTAPSGSSIFSPLSVAFASTSPTWPASGPAVLTVSATGNAPGNVDTNPPTTTNFNGTTFSFSNSSGLAAKNVTMQLQYTGTSGQTGSGVASGSR